VADRSTALVRLLGGRTASALAARDVRTVGDFLDFLPRRYLDPSTATDLGQLHPDDYAVVVARVRSATTRPLRGRRGRMLTAVVTDGTSELHLTFFKAFGHENRLLPGRLGIFAGTVGTYQRSLQLTHPDYELLEDGEAGEALSTYGGGLIPVYLQVPRVSSWVVTKSARIVFDHLEELDDPIPADVRERRSLPGLLEAYRLLHLPANRSDVARGLRRLRFDEAFTLQTVLARRRALDEGLRTTPRPGRPGGVLEAFDARLPFELTGGQRTVAAVLSDDLARDRPMHRLLQGEVGSGKTVLALRAMLAVVDTGGQAALLAPTEVLAAQHHRSITAMLGELGRRGQLDGTDIGTRVALLSGSQSSGRRRQALLEVASGDAGIVVGTHALIQDEVQFADLGLVVVDEQHRFGVEQRDALRAKAALAPHVLVMTATPIPRTVAMTVFGDMETSTLTELPAGRSPITTHVVDNPRWVQRAWQRVAEEVRAGHQVYVVCPRIGAVGDHGDGSDAEDAADPVAEDGELASPPRRHLSLVPDLSADAEAAAPGERPPRGVLDVLSDLRAMPVLTGLRIEVLHGRMPAEDKDATMQAFTDGAVDVLVATTVIEVGVDVPNATVMVVMDADRFGISALHQLRGRVGRGAAPGLCLLFTETPTAGPEGLGAAHERLTSVAATTDGFELARLDLEQRKEGDVLGSAQSGGHRQLRLLRLLRDEDLILQAREDAFALVALDPRLERHVGLRERIASALDAEQTAYLERG